LAVLAYADMLKEEGFKTEYMKLIIAQSKTIISVLDSGSFEIRDQISFLVGILKMVRKSTEENAEILEKMLNACQGVKKILENIRVCENVKKPKQFIFGQVINDLRSVSEVEISFDESLLVFEGDCLFPQTIFNLIKNSVFHGKATRIDMRTEKVNRGGEGFISLIIEDNGSGIPERVRGKIFERGVTTRDTKNGGDGLFLVKQILELSGIFIDEVSEISAGAKFELLIPCSNVFCYKPHIS
jgi:signal transduction histidine kinase